MTPKMRVALVLLVVSMTASRCSAQGQSDSEIFAQGRVALDKYKDCTAARGAFEAESPAAKDSAIWLDYAARASECTGDLGLALDYYERELKKLPGTPRLIDKVGDLRYRIQSLQDQAARKAAQEETLVQQQAALVQQQSRAYADAVSQLPQTTAAIGQILTQSFEDDRKGDYGKHAAFLTRTMTGYSRCGLSFDEDYRGRVKFRRRVDISFVGATADSASGPKFERGGIAIRWNGASPGYVELDTDYKIDLRDFRKLLASAALACSR